MMQLNNHSRVLGLKTRHGDNEDRNLEPKQDFGLPDERKYPSRIKDAANAKARAEEQHEKGNLSARKKKRLTQRPTKNCRPSCNRNPQRKSAPEMRWGR